MRSIVSLGLLFLATSVTAQSLEGVWQSRGWALTVRFNGPSVELYQSTTTSLLPLGELPLQDGAIELDARTTLTFLRNDQELTLSDSEGTVRIDFQPLDALPPVSAFDADPVSNFDLFVALFEENYALFDINGVDWAALTAAERTSIHAETSNVALFDALQRLIQPLSDRHVTLTDGTRFTQSGPPADPFWNAQQTAILNNLRTRHLDGAVLQTAPGDDRIRFGLISGQTLYVAILSFSATSDATPRLADSLDHAIDRFPGADSMIVDLRFNGGGRESNGLALLNRMGDQAQVVYARETRSTLDQGFTPAESVSTTPVPGLPKPTVLLVSNESASTADKVALAGAFMPWATLVGIATKGIFSNTLDLVLPNGWAVGLSHQRTYSVAGGFFEQQGVAPDIPVAIDLEDVSTGSDPMMDAALDHLEKQPRPAGASWSVDARNSGVWFDPNRGGEGWLVEVLPDERAFVTWFSYPPDGETRQAWMTAVGSVQGHRIVLDEVATTSGARFGDEFDPGDVVFADWGTIEFHFEACAAGYVTYQGPSGFRSGAQRLSRLAPVHGLDCSAEVEAFDPASSGRFSGSWFDPERAGEGWMLTVFSDNDAFVAWFTYDPAGNPAWMVGNGVVDGDRIVFSDMIYPRGGLFGPRFDPAAVEATPWGQMEFEFAGCDGLTIDYASSLPAFGSGRRNAVRLTQPAGVICQP